MLTEGVKSTFKDAAIRTLVDNHSQADPQMRTTFAYTKIVGSNAVPFSLSLGL